MKLPAAAPAASQALCPDIDSATLMRFGEEAIAVNECLSFRKLVRGAVRDLLPHQGLIAAIGRMAFEQVEAVHLLEVDAPAGMLEQAPKTIHLRERPGIDRWLATREPVVIPPDKTAELLASRGQREVEVFGLGTIATHGLVDLSANMGSFFFFSGLAPEMPIDQATRRLKIVCPLLHTALVQVQDLVSCSPNPLDKLTRIEQELLAWVAAGRTNAQIALMRGRSPSTIRNQLEEIYRKLGVGNRAEVAHLVASLGLAARFTPLSGAGYPPPPKDD